MVSKKWLLTMIILVLGLAACGSGDDEKDNSTPLALSANAGEDFSLTVGEIPTFDGCASTGDIENYQWVILEAPESKVSDAGKVIRAIESNCKFTLEDAMVIEEVGEWVIQLEVRGKNDATSADTVSINVQAP